VRRPPVSRPQAPGRALAALLVFTAGCGAPEIPEVSFGGMEPAVSQAIRGAREALAADRRDPAAWGRFGMVLHAHRLNDAASLAYTEAARLDDDDHRWPHLHGRLLEAAAPARALSLADEALRRNPRFPPSLALRARTLEATGDGAAAEAAWEALRATAPRSVEASLALGRRRLSRGELHDAQSAFERVVELLPASAAGWSFLAQVHGRLGEPNGAATAAARARAAARSPSLGETADPDPLLIAVEDLRADSRGREARARRAAASGDHDAAEAIYRDLVSERPDSADLHYNHGNSLARLGRSDEAEAAYREALARDPDSSAAMANLANLLARRGRDRDADDLYRSSIAADPSHLPTLLGASSLQFQRGDLRQAERYLRDALALEPGHPGALQGLGQLLATAGRLGEAAKTLSRALTAARGEGAASGQLAGIHFLLADVERQRGRTAQARSHLADAEALGMNVPPAFRALLEPER
jgi:tetratricopeptide (TPR) repeat protein